jgi:chemotaxis protein methyltransferase CheR
LSAPAAERPGDATVLAQRARAAADEGRLAEARAWCEQAIAADKLNPAGHYLLAIIAQEEGQLAASEAAVRRALYLDPDFVLAHFAAGNLARRQDRRAEAARHFATALSLLRRYGQDDLLPEAEGMTAGRLRAIISAIRLREE